MTMMATSDAVSIFWVADKPASWRWTRSSWALSQSMCRPSLALWCGRSGPHADLRSRRAGTAPHSSDANALDLLVGVHQLGPDGQQRLERQVTFFDGGHHAGHVFGLPRRHVLDGLARVLLKARDLVDALLERVGEAGAARGRGGRAGTRGDSAAGELRNEVGIGAGD